MKNTFKKVGIHLLFIQYSLVFITHLIVERNSKFNLKKTIENCLNPFIIIQVPCSKDNTIFVTHKVSPTWDGEKFNQLVSKVTLN